MPPSSPRVSIPLELSADHPALLQGLDALLKLGLLSDRQIRDICRRSLSSPLPSVKPAVRTPAAQPVAASTAKVTSQTATSRPAPTPKKPGLIQSAIGRLMAELSIVWLLCLGVFLVVVSSALLAATQWASFSPSAQYLVLFAYTAVFWLIGLWASRQTHLALTAKTLQTVSLLLVPINLWAMHGLQITASGTGLLVAIAATLLLGLGSLSSFWQYGGDRADASVWLNGCAFLALAVGHWLRWATPTAAIVIYGSLGLTAIALVAQPQVRQGWRASSNTSSSGSPVLNSARLMVIYALGVVLLRGITIEPIEPDTLGLAVGGTGALLCSLALPAWRPSRSGSSKSKSVAQNNSDRTREPKSSSQTEAIPSQQAHSADATAAVANPFGDRPLIEPSPARPSTTRSSLTRSRSDQVSAKSAAPSISQDPKTGFTSLWILVGRSLMLVGWAMAITHLPLQALGVSVMGLVLRTDRLKRLWLRRDLSVALLLGLHIIWLNWRSLSETWQSAAIAAAEQLIGDVNAGSWVLTGLAYLPYVVLTVGIADALVRRGKDKLAGLAFNWAFLLGSGLTLISAFDGTVLAINLITSALTFLVVTLRRRRRGHKIEGWVYFTHGLGLVAIAAAISDAVDNLSPEAIALCCFSLVAVELGLSVGRRNPWRRSAWLFGLGLVGLGDWLLLNYGLSSQIGLSWLLLGLVPPVVLTLICTRPAPQQRRASYPLAIATLLFAVVLCLGSATTRPAGLGIAALLAVLLTALRPGGAIASLTVGLGLGFIASTIQDLIPDAPLLTGVQWYPIGAIACGLLWLSWRGLSYRSQTTAAEEQTQWINAYRTACNGWGFALCFGLLVLLSGELILRYFNVRDFEPTYAWAAGGLAVAGLLRSGRSLHGSAWFAIGWAVELMTAELLAQSEVSWLELAIANLALGAISLMLATVLSQNRTLPISLQAWPILYSILALVLRVGAFTSWTGWLTLGAALIILETGRQQGLRWLRAIALLLMSLAWYELVIYQLSLASGGNPGDGWVILAGVAAVIMAAYQLLSRWLSTSIGLPPAEFRWAAHLHWFIGSLLMLASVGYVAAPFAEPLATAPFAVLIGIVLTSYALLHGRQTKDISIALKPVNTRSSSPALAAKLERSKVKTNPAPGPSANAVAWTWAGIGQLSAGLIHLRLLYPELAVLDPWIGVCAAVLASGFYYGRWRRWGWPAGPWHKAAIALPLAAALFGLGTDAHSLNLWVTAGFYGGIAWQSRRIRLSYLSATLIVLAIYQWLFERGIGDVLAYSLPIGAWLLYIAQIDSRFQNRQHLQQRHWLRIVAMGLILGVGLVSNRWTGIPVGILSLGAIGFGLALQVRAFLYSGTIVLVLNVLNQLVLLNSEFPLTKWIIGMVVGILLIWIAADFERRREQWSTLAQRWQDILNRWE